MSLVIDDAHIGAVKTYFMEQCESINDIKNKYVTAMENLIENGIVDGDTAEALKEFLEKIECDLGDNTATPWLMSSQVERLCDNFIKRVDKADKQIY